MIGDVLNALSDHGCRPRRSGDGYNARCPAHDDHNPSLSVTDGDKGGVVVTCHRGCDLDAVLAALALDRDSIRPPRDGQRDGEWTPFGAPLDIYRYTDEDGALLFEVVRCRNKQFPCRRPDPTAPSGWSWKLGNVRRPLYRLPQVLKAIEDGEPIFVAEGEKDVRALEQAGCVATCNPGGASEKTGKWLPEHTETLAEADVIIVADCDDVGRSHARRIAKALEGVARSVQRVEAAVGKDAFDHLAAGKTVEEFLIVSDDEREFDLAPDLEEFLAEEDDAYQWLVPGLLEKGDRLLLTGYEGAGKSHLLRQMAVCIAAGIHPFRFDHVAPHKVLLIDCENPKRHTRRKLRPIRDLAANALRPVEAGMLRIIVRPNGLDLTTEEDAAWLYERVIGHKPELLIIGPVYRLHAQNPNDELAARAVTIAVDAARTAVDCAVIMEAHSGHGDGFRERGVRPVGSSLWLRWPEFGYGVVPQQDRGEYREYAWLRSWRGPRDERQWPDELHRGQVWPWEGMWSKGMPKLEETEVEF